MAPRATSWPRRRCRCSWPIEHFRGLGSRRVQQKRVWAGSKRTGQSSNPPLTLVRELHQEIAMTKVVRLAFILSSSILVHCIFGSGVNAANNDAKEASDRAERVINRLMLRLPNQQAISLRTHGEQSDAVIKEYFHYSSANWRIAPEALSIADQLNGLTWKGKVYIEVPAYRTLFESKSNPLFSSDRKTCWDAWQDRAAGKDLGFSLQKKNGAWEGYFNSDEILGRAPTQNDVDRILKTPACSSGPSPLRSSNILE